MGLITDRSDTAQPDILDLVETCLTEAGWEYQRETEDGALQALAASQWGEMGSMFALRAEPPALHFSITLDVKPTPARRNEIAHLVLMANERLWLGHFDFWHDEGVILYRHTLPLLGRSQADPGEIHAMLAAGLDSVNMFVPAFNFVIWAGKSAAEALEAALFETAGEA